MHLFYLINGWAGRNDIADAILRFFYVGAVPALATLLAALLILAPRLPKAPSRGRTAAAMLLAVLLCGLAMGGVNAFAAHYLDTDVLSPRPFVTRYVHLLVVEPNDNSFPCPEVMVAAALATVLCSVAPTIGMVGWAMVVLLGFARVYCGSNYVADSLVGAALGSMLTSVSLAVWRVPLQLPLRHGQRLIWRLRHQAVLSSVMVLLIAVSSLIIFGRTPRYAGKMARLFREPTATAAPSNAASAGSTLAKTTPETSVVYSTTGTRTTHEGEGVAPVEAPQPLLSSSATRLDGHQPEAERRLKRDLDELHLPHRIIGVNVAQVRAGTTAYRCAAVRFEVSGRGVAERRKVTATAADIVKTAFRSDPELQHIDVLGVVLSGSNAANTVDLAEDKHILESGIVPVFTASVMRQNLHLTSGPRWLNWEDLNAGLWLRARSQLYINAQILPAVAPRPTPLPTATPVPTATPTATPVPTATTVPTPTSVPTATPVPTATSPATPTPIPRPTATQVRVVPKVVPVVPKRLAPRAVAGKSTTKKPVRSSIKQLAPNRRATTRSTSTERRAVKRRTVRRRVRRTVRRRTYRRGTRWRMRTNSSGRRYKQYY